MTKREGLFSLFGASDDMLRFLEDKEVALKIAAELVRFEKATNEARARRLVERHVESPLTVHEIVALRKREQRARGDSPANQSDEKTEEIQVGRKRAQPESRLIDRLEAVVRRRPDAFGQIEELFGVNPWRLSCRLTCSRSRRGV